MTVKEAIDEKIKKIRLPEWAEGIYAELPMNNSIWVKIHDPFAGDCEIPVFELKTDEWEIY